MEDEGQDEGQDEGDAGRLAGDELQMETRGGKQLQKNKSRQILSDIAGMVVPSLTFQKGKEKMSTRKSMLIVMSLYASHSFSAWGDRMWGFAVSLLLATLYPGSLLLPGIHGFVVQLTVAIFGTVVGDWVDYTSRMKVATTTLVVQNGLLSIASVGMALMFWFNWTVCLNVVVFSVLTVFIVILASGANLATVANTISIEKDWVVVIADGNVDTLATLNANMRRIDLCCKLLAPALTGVILQYAGSFTTTAIVAIWNVGSFFGELSLLWIVYKLVPNLSLKKVRGSVLQEDKKIQYVDEDNNMELDSIGAEDTILLQEEDAGDTDEEVTTSVALQQKNMCANQCFKLLNIFSTFKTGWRIYIRQEIALVGFSLASIYLTVLGFSGVTSSYFLTQGLRNDLIGVFQGVGAIFGVFGTILYPFLRRRFGTVRTGLFGISTQLLILTFCIAAIVVPSSRTSSEATGYYSPDCRNETEVDMDMLMETLVPSTACVHPTISPSQTYNTPSVSSIPVPLNNCTPSSNSTAEGGRNIALILMLVGVVACRTGLWVFDLAVQQLIQEKVVEEERGVVSGVINAMIAIMDMLHYVLVIAAPRPEHFRVLTAISFFMVFVGWLLYSIYVRKSRGHFFHCKDFANFLLKRRNASQVTSAVEK